MCIFGLPTASANAFKARPVSLERAFCVGGVMAEKENKTIVLIGTYKGNQLEKWPDYYNYPISEADKITAADATRINELWLFKGDDEVKAFKAEFLGFKTHEELIADYAYPVKGKAHGDKYLLFKIERKEYPCTNDYKAILRARDFTRSKKNQNSVKVYLESESREESSISSCIPSILRSVPKECLHVCESAFQLNFFETLYSSSTPEPLVYEIETATKKLRSIDLFAGIGGIRLGFDKAFGNAIETVFVSEWDEYAQKTYRTNFGMLPTIAGDITKVDEKDIPEFDICLAGFPCQAFSLAGQRMGFQDNYKGLCRGTLFMDVARICEYHKPKVIFCENVKGLVIHDRGRTFKIICKTFEDLGYKVFYQVLNSKDFGVPQNRERIYVVAFRNDVAPETFEFPKATDTSKRICDILEKKPVPAKYYLSDVYVETLRKHKERHAAKGHGFGYEIRSLDGIAGAIVCGGMGRERNLLIDKRQTNLTPTTHIKGKINEEGIRKMTPREWARLQGFPDDYQLKIADVHLYKQFGNSVTVNVIEAIAHAIKEVLNDK